MFKTYIDKKFTKATLDIIETANEIIREYEQRSMSLTLRQLYYQFVARDLLKNTINNYKRLGSIMSDARLAGLVDWNSMEDRTRSLYGITTYDDAGDFVDLVQYRFAMDLWEGQQYRPEVWIEKDALSGVISRVCNELRIDYFPCKGYVSQSMMWRSARRMRSDGHANDQIPVVLHFGDHDPSGMDMSRDIQDRLDLFEAGDVHYEFHRLALNFDQIEQYDPPPNPAKVTDTRAASYIAEYGNESWELDALPPEAFADLIRNKVLEYRDEDKWWNAQQAERDQKQKLSDFIDSFNDK